MIPARPGTTATIGDDRVPVEAWDDEGRALVIDSPSGCLVPAESLDGFERVDPADVISIIPGSGWHARYEIDPSSGSSTTGVVAWGLKADGRLAAYVPPGYVPAGERGVEEVEAGPGLRFVPDV